jgi:hypothetical protein
LSGLDHEELNAVFQACVWRVRELSDGNEGYIGW